MIKKFKNGDVVALNSSPAIPVTISSYHSSTDFVTVHWFDKTGEHKTTRVHQDALTPFTGPK